MLSFWVVFDTFRRLCNLSDGRSGYREIVKDKLAGCDVTSQPFHDSG